MSTRSVDCRRWPGRCEPKVAGSSTSRSVIRGSPPRPSSSRRPGTRSRRSRSIRPRPGFRSCGKRLPDTSRAASESRSIPSTQVMPTSGGKESIFSSHLAFVDRDRSDVVAWPTPGYPIYQRGAVLAGATPYPVRLSGDFVMRAADIPDQIWDAGGDGVDLHPTQPGRIGDFGRRARGRSTSRPASTTRCSAPTSVTPTCTTRSHPVRYCRLRVRDRRDVSRSSPSPNDRA